MSDVPPARPDVRPPIVAAPAPFVERRVAFRRAADRLAHRETTLLARSLDVLALDDGADARLAGVLDLLAATAGARRAAVVAGLHGERRVAVSRAPGEDDTDALELGAWLDAWAPRPRSHRAASGPASILVVTSRREAARPPVATLDPSAPRHYAFLPVPTAGDVVLGFDFAEEAGAAELAERLPPQLARHAAVALALVTGQVTTERELDALRAREAERDRFVSTVAHELRTPLTGLAGYLELILDGQVDDPADERDFLERSRQIVESMGELVGDLLELSRLESGSLRLEIAPFSLAEVGSRVVDGLAPIALARSVTIRTSLPPRLRSALGDRRRVEQIVTNLASNALKFAPAGTTVEVAAWFDGALGVLAVRDEGSGIASDDRARIFERFHRLAGHERITGTGLGLPIARDLAEAMGGALGVASVPGSGSSFVLVLPGPGSPLAEPLEPSLETLVAAEELRLEERAVLRAMADAAPRPRLVPGRERDRDAGAADDDGDDPRRDGPSGPGAGGRRPRLRAIDGLAHRNPDAAPA
jgi:signal transduction histidine kinase